MLHDNCTERIWHSILYNREWRQQNLKHKEEKKNPCKKACHESSQPPAPSKLKNVQQRKTVKSSYTLRQQKFCYSLILKAQHYLGAKPSCWIGTQKRLPCLESTLLRVSLSLSWNYLFPSATKEGFSLPTCSPWLPHTSVHAYNAKAGMLDEEYQIFHCCPKYGVTERSIWARKMRLKGLHFQVCGSPSFTKEVSENSKHVTLQAANKKKTVIVVSKSFSWGKGRMNNWSQHGDPGRQNGRLSSRM